MTRERGMHFPDARDGLPDVLCHGSARPLECEDALRLRPPSP